MKEDFEKYELILWDADDTLFDFGRSEAEAFRTTFAESHPGTLLEELYIKYRVINRDLWERVALGKLEKSELNGRRFQSLLPDWKKEDTVDIGHQFLQTLSTMVYLKPYAREICETLRRKARLVIVTNGIERVQLPRFEKSELRPLFEFMVVSETVGYPKPAKEIFAHTLEKAGNPTLSSVLMIGDSLPTDIQGGINFGIDTCWTRFGQARSSQIHPKYEVENLEDLGRKLH